MNVRVLGCSGAIAARSRTTAFLLGDNVLFDAGTGVGDLTLPELARIDHIFISHSHLDHVLSIGLLADSVMRRRTNERRPPIRLHALPETISALKAHLFNGVIWPDFTRLPNAEHPILQFAPFSVGDTLEIGNRQVEVLSAVHTVPAVGFAVHGGARGTWVYTGDTGPNPALWERLRDVKVAHLVIETAFSDEERHVAHISRHLCPSTLREELAQFSGDVDVHITHIKPGELKAVMPQISALGLGHRIRALRNGDVLLLD